MIKDGPVKELRRLLRLGRSLAVSARMSEMTEKTARKYRDDGRLPSERKTARNYPHWILNLKTRHFKDASNTPEPC